MATSTFSYGVWVGRVCPLMVCEWGKCVLDPHVCGCDCAMTSDNTLWFLSAYVILLLTSFRGLLLDLRYCVLRSSSITRGLMFGAMCKTPCLASLSCFL